MRQIIFLILFVTTLLQAVELEPGPYSLRLGFGHSDLNDLGEILAGDWHPYPEKTTAFNLDGGCRLSHNTFSWPLDIYLKGGLSYFDEKGVLFQGKRYKDVLEATFYIKAYLKLDFWQNRVRLGAGEGLSLAQEIPVVEVVDATNGEGTVDPTAKFLNYLDFSIDFDVGRLIRVKSMQELYLGYTLKHRSGVFGLFNGVHGGSNYNMFTLEKNF